MPSVQEVLGSNPVGNSGLNRFFFFTIVTCWLYIVSPPPKNMFFVNTPIFGGCLALKVMFSKCVLFHGLLNLKRYWK